MSREKSSRPNKLKTFLSPKPKICSAVDEEKQPDLERLDSRLCEFYNSDYAPRYYESAEKRNDVWTADMKGLHASEERYTRWQQCHRSWLRIDSLVPEPGGTRGGLH